MLRFILNFFLFGILFYLIYLFFPEAFHTLVSWANDIYQFFKDLFIRLSDKIHSSGESVNRREAQRALLLSLCGMSLFGRE